MPKLYKNKYVFLFFWLTDARTLGDAVGGFGNVLRAILAVLGALGDVLEVLGGVLEAIIGVLEYLEASGRRLGRS